MENVSVKERQLNILKSLVNEDIREGVKRGLDNIHSHMEDYHLYRYIASFVESRERNEDIRHSIASWMVHSKHENLPFNDIFVIDDEVYIYTYRPGLWIGKGGKTIDDCTYHINHKVDGTEYRKLNIHLIEIRNDAVSDVYRYMRVCQPYSDANECWDDIPDCEIKPVKFEVPKTNKIKI